GRVAGAAGADGAPFVEDSRRDLERRMRPAELFPGEGDFLIAERRAVNARSALLVGRAKADGGAAGDQRWLVGLARGGDGRFDLGRVMAVNGAEIPAGCFKAPLLAFRDGEIGRAVDGDR